jgi:hypothetical protein
VQPIHPLTAVEVDTRDKAFETIGRAALRRVGARKHCYAHTPVSGTVHFWTQHEGFDGWDPDLEPDRFNSTFGHSFLELYVRLKARGFPATVGPRPSTATHAIVASLEELALWRDRLAPGPVTRLALAVARSPTVVLVRGDLPLTTPVPRYVRTEVMPTEASITDPARQITMPLLPQRGIIRRNRDRHERIERVALKGYRHNIPDELLDPTFVERLREIDVEFRIDTEDDKPLRWHDYRDVDVALCVRRFHPEFDTDERYIRKPATKLVNAWSAGVIPIVAPEAGYLEEMDEGRDAIVASDTDEIVAALQELRDDPEYVRKLLAHGEAKAAGWTTDAVLDKWQRLLESELPSSSRIEALASAVAHTPMMVIERLRRTRASRQQTRDLL